MKKILKTALVATLALLLFIAAACGTGKDNGNDGRTKIKISVYAAGYGLGWIEDAARQYEEYNPDVRFEIEGNSRMFETIKTRLDSNVNDSDIILVAGGDYRNFVRRGYLEDISDLYDRVIIDTEDTTVREAVDGMLYDYYTIDSKIYGVPWQDNTASGFVYNKKLFDSNGWEIPDTMDGFFELCNKIAATGIAPLTFGGGQQGAYMYVAAVQWFTEYYGFEYMRDTFFKYLSPQQYADTEEGRTKVYETLARLFNGTTQSGASIALAGSKAFTAQAAQRELVKGAAAMTICGQWFPTEMSTYLQGYPNFEYGYMPLPHINSDSKDVDGNDSSSVRYSLDGNILAIPANAKHKDIAKDFLAHMFTKDSYTGFVENNNGLLRPINIEINTSDLSPFAKAGYDFYIQGKVNGTFLYNVSSAPIALNGYLSPLISDSGNAVNNLINASNYTAALTVARQAAKSDYTQALKMWDEEANDWSSSYLGVN